MRRRTAALQWCIWLLHFMYTSSSGETGPTPAGWITHDTPVPGQWIVAFHTYALPHEQPAMLQEALGPGSAAACPFQVQDRPAPMFQTRVTDFALVALPELCAPLVVRQWRAHPLVRSVWPQSRIERQQPRGPGERRVSQDETPAAGGAASDGPQGPQGVTVLPSLLDDDVRLRSGTSTAGARTLKAAPLDVLAALNVPKVWEHGTRGSRVRVAVFDTGIVQSHPHFKGRVVVKTCINYTDGKTCEDGFGHGTFVAGVIASAGECRGIVPDAELHIFKVEAGTTKGAGCACGCSCHTVPSNGSRPPPPPPPPL